MATIAQLDPRGDPSLVELAFRHLRSSILRAELEPGARLRLEALQEQLSLSSSPLREALNRLAAMGLVEAVDRRGFRVKPISIEELNDLTRVRVLLEREALKEAMARGGDDWEAGALAALHRMQLAAGRLNGADLVLDEAWSARHREFHFALLSACGSPNLVRLCAEYFMQSERYRHISARFRKAGKNAADGHRKLLEVILRRNVKAGLELITDHIEHTAKGVAAALANYPFGKGGSRPASEDAARL